MVSDHGCIRVFKQAKILIDAGYKVDLFCRKEPFGWNIFNTVSIFDDAEQLHRLVDEAQADILHVHNEPDWLIYETKVAAKVPVIFDVHDVQCLRIQSTSREEELAFDAADAFIFVGDHARVLTSSFYTLDKPTTVIMSMVNKDFLCDVTWGANFDSVCYEGGIRPPDHQPVLNGTHFVNYRDYMPAVKAFTNQGFNFTIHKANKAYTEEYAKAGANVIEPMLYHYMLRALHLHGFGLVGSCYHVVAMHAAMPNKLFVYMSQGVVPIVLNAATVGEFVIGNKLGYELESLFDIRSQLKGRDHNEKTRKRVIANRKKYTMETQLDKLSKFYEEVLDA